MAALEELRVATVAAPFSESPERAFEDPRRDTVAPPESPSTPAPLVDVLGDPRPLPTRFRVPPPDARARVFEDATPESVETELTVA